jgi:chorismate mutase/prephenate dehydratase
VVGRKLFPRSGTDKTTLLISSRQSGGPGALHRLLLPLSRHKVNMSRIESRPSRQRKWHYVFFLDVEGHAEDGPVAKALESLRKEAQLFRVLGSYPKAVL